MYFWCLVFICYVSFLAELLNEVERLRESYKIEKDAEKKKNTVALIRKFLIKNQEHGDSKLRTVAKIQDMIEVKARQLDLDFENLGMK